MDCRRHWRCVSSSPSVPHARPCAPHSLALALARTLSFIAPFSLRHSRLHTRTTLFTRTGDLSKLRELRATSTTSQDAFLAAVSAELGGQPYLSSGPDGLSLILKGSKLMVKDGAVMAVTALIIATDGGITCPCGLPPMRQ